MYDRDSLKKKRKENYIKVIYKICLWNISLEILCLMQMFKKQNTYLKH